MLITFEGITIDEINEKIIAHAKLVAPKLNADQEESSAESKKKKVKAEKPSESSVAPKQAAVTVAAAREAVNELVGSKGLEVAKAVLATFDCERISEVKPEQIAELILACKERLAG